MPELEWLAQGKENLIEWLSKAGKDKMGVVWSSVPQILKSHDFVWTKVLLLVATYRSNLNLAISSMKQ